MNHESRETQGTVAVRAQVDLKEVAVAQLQLIVGMEEGKAGQIFRFFKTGCKSGFLCKLS